MWMAHYRWKAYRFSQEGSKEAEIRTLTEELRKCQQDGTRQVSECSPLVEFVVVLVVVRVGGSIEAHRSTAIILSNVVAMSICSLDCINSY